MNANEIREIVADVVASSPPPTSFSAMSAKDRDYHSERRERLGLTEAEYLSRFVTAADTAEDAEIDAIASSARTRGRS
ncbi:hypothetical protein N865_01435 [Intrasporangium oryzae NRRL B-24470]|uniref:Uncharacterized protein n=1 Tax=Intrasporangium oryzae NRRL B-24470 TaxID=1386089 RepID=W9G0X0_9MICO|nr:hypothetical protein [Intrasporangium oryzae]EWS99569.1 hypothetical protein N865_01435 [Intrasporangium oryzae NRRL B-24470]